ncbi:NifB/NifX family molybdenum-iron cluster-binding protein [Candidatus Margulisiibacteriota bacterium]
MKICIPTGTDKGLKEKVFPHFGSAPYFLVYDTDVENFNIINNRNKHHVHGMCQPLTALEGLEIDAVVCGGMGARAIMKLNEGGIKAYRAAAITVEDIIEKYKNGGLEEITVEKACTDHSCH